MNGNLRNMMIPLLAELIEEEQRFMANIAQLINLYLDNPQNYLVLLAFREKHSRVPLYAEEWLIRYTEYDFFQLFRMKRESFYILLEKINCNAVNKEFVGGYPPIPGEKMLLITLWWLGKGEVLLSVADRFNVSLSAAHTCMSVLLDIFISLLPQYIIWPDRNELERTEVVFQNKAGFPGVVGAIDVCNIKIKAPVEQQASYIDRKQQHSIKLQAIVSPHKVFTNIYVGFPGSAHDSRVLHNSGIYLDTEENGHYRKYFPLDDYHIIGDSAYPLKKWLMKPYKVTHQMNVMKTSFNIKLSQTRVCVEHTFGILKSRWRILNYVNVNSIERAVKIITACCLLHNFCYVYNDNWDQYVENIVYEDGQDRDNEDRNADGIHKRNEITRMLPQAN